MKNYIFLFLAVLLIGCGAPAPEAESDSDQNFERITRDDDPVVVDMGVYQFVGEVSPHLIYPIEAITDGEFVIERESLSPVERPFLFDGDKSLVKLRVDGADYYPIDESFSLVDGRQIFDPTYFENSEIVLKVSDGKIRSVEVGDVITIWCRLDPEMLAPVVEREEINPQLLVPEFDFCRLPSAVVSMPEAGLVAPIPFEFFKTEE